MLWVVVLADDGLRFDNLDARQLRGPLKQCLCGNPDPRAMTPPMYSPRGDT